MSLTSVTIFAGILISTAAEIRDTRWFWQRSKTPLEWLLCFPLGTRPSGRVFFWSYVYYLSRFLSKLHLRPMILRQCSLFCPIMEAKKIGYVERDIKTTWSPTSLTIRQQPKASTFQLLKPEKRKGVLVPASGSKWAELIVSNPWRNQDYVELGKEYLHPLDCAGQHTGYGKLIEFLEKYANASDIPNIYPPNGGFSSVETPLTKKNALLLLDWIRNLKRKGGNLLDKFLKCIKEGSWLKVTVNDWRPPSKSFLIRSSLGRILQSGYVLVDIPLIDEGFYGNQISEYEEELKTIGVMFSCEEACAFIGRELMLRVASFTLSRNHILLMLEFIQYLRKNYLPLDQFVKCIKEGSWLRTSHGLRCPKGSVLYDSDWLVASQVSSIPFIDKDFFGEGIYKFKEELKLLGVVVGFDENYKVVIDHLKSSSDLANLTAEAVVLLMECIKFLRGSSKHINSLKGARCLKTIMGFKTPSKCFLRDPLWDCILEVFDCLPIIDHQFYGEKIFSYKEELKHIGVVIHFDEAIKKFADLFKQKASQASFNHHHVKSFLSCCRVLKGTDYKFPPEFSNIIHTEKWLQTRVGGYRSPRACIFYGPEWKAISSIASCLPFIDDSEKCCGEGIHEYKEELKSIGVVTEVKDGVKFVFKCLNFPSDRSTIILGFLSSSSLKMERSKRHEVVQDLFNLSFFETKGAVTASYTLSLSSGDKIIKKANRMVRWQRQSSKFFTQMNWQSEDASLLKYATYFSEAISEV